MPKGELLMRGSYQVIIQNNRVQFKLTINRNLTIIQGNSATGKTTLLDMVAAHEELGAQSGVTVSCKVPCKTISGKYWRRDLQEISSSIVLLMRAILLFDQENLPMKQNVAQTTT